MSELLTADINKIMELLPHRSPFLLVDRVIDIDPGTSATGIKCVTYNEPFFPGHFPDHPIMPGVLIIEAMAQTSAICVQIGDETPGDSLVFFMSVEEAKFRKPVTPGDRLEFKVKLLRERRGVCKFQGKAYVDDTLHAEAIFTAMISKA